MKVLILGANGQIGRSISEIFSPNLKQFKYSKDQLSILDNENLLEVFKKIDPDVVINCAAYTKVDLAEKEREKANQINRRPQLCSRVCFKISSRKTLGPNPL